MDGLTAAALRHPRWTVAIYAGLIALAGVGALRLESETGYRAALGAGHPSVERLDRFIADFGAGLPVQIAWGCDLADEPCSDALSSERLAAAERIAASIEALPGVLSVRTPGSTPLSDGSHGGIDSLTLRAVEADAAERHRFIERARSNPFWQGVLIAEDARAAALVLELESSDPHRHDATLHTLLKSIEAESGPYALVGDPVDFVLGGAALNREARKLGAVAMGLVALIVWLLFRTPLAIVPVLTAVGIAAIACLGLMGWMGWPENEISQAIVPLLLVIGVCGSIHLMSRYRDLPTSSPRLRDASRPERLVAAARDVGWPCFVAALTTAVGLGSFVTSDLVGFVRFGVASSFGAFIAWVATFTVLPVLIHALRLELPELQHSEGWARALRWLGLATRRYARTIVVGTGLLLLIGIGGTLRLEVDVTKESLLGSESVIVRWQHWVAAHLRKPDSLEVRLRLPEGASLAEVGTLGVVAEVVAFLESIPELGRARSVLDGVEHMNQLLHGGEPAMARLGATRAENAQLLFALESYDRDLLSSWVTPDRSALRVSSEALLLSRRERGALLERVNAHLESALPKGWSYELTGPLQVFADMVTELHKTQLRSFVGAMLAVAAAIGLCLRSATAVVWAMFPSLLPIVITLGAMGWMGTPLDTGTAMIAAIVLGIAVDDSVHLIVRYRRHRESGMGPSAAMTWSLEEVGRALVASSLALSAGFLVMLLSSWGGIAAFGLLSACAIQFALLADLLFLPALVYCLDHSSWEDSPESLCRDLEGRQRTRQLVVACVALGAVALHALVGFELSSADLMAADATARVHGLLIGMSALLLSVCLLTAWRSREEGATALALTGASIGALALSIAVPASETAAIAGVAALCLLPAALVHMGLVFPARRGVLAVSPLFLRMLYAVVALVVVVALTTYFRFPQLYTFVAPMLLVAAGAAGFDLFLHARHHARTTVSAKERTQAQMLVSGSLVTGALVTLCYVAFQWMDRSLPGGSDSFVAFALLSAIGPLTYAIQPDRLFDVRYQGPAALRMAARGATLVALVIAFETVLDSPTPSVSGFGLTVLLAWGSMEFVDRALLKRLVAPRRRSKLEEIATFDATAVVGGNLTTESEVANQIVARVQATLMPQFVAVFFRRPQGWFPAAASDSAPTEENLAAAAYALVANGELTYLPDSQAVHLSQEDGFAAAVSTLLVEGVETLVPLSGERGRRGIVILGAASRMLSARDRVYLTRLGRQAISALSWADAAEQLGAARALARRGFLSAALAHDLGKPLTTIWGAARSLRRLRATDELVDQRLLEMQQVADQGLAIIDQLFAKAKEEPGGTLPAGELVAMACRAAEEQHGHAIQIQYGSDLHGVSLASEVAEALGELLSNACRESPSGVPVEVSALVTRPNVLWIDVVDRGAGMTESVAARAFEPWFSQRQDVGGRGLGLALCRLLVRQVGGEVEIVDRGGRAGTRMRISVDVLREIEGDS